MAKKIIFVLFGLVCLFALITVLFAVTYLKIGQKSILDENRPVFVQEPSKIETSSDSKTGVEELDPHSFSIEVFAEGLDVPWGMLFTDEHRILVTQRPGQIKQIIDGKVQNEPLHTFPEVSHTIEEGLMGITKDPEYDRNAFLYVCLTYEENSKKYDKVVKLKDEQNALSVESVILDHIPAAKFHAGCRIQFGPDDKLYITTGDATEKNSAQERSALSGKILRINADGSIPQDNPFPNSPVFSYGHRNPQGLDWHPVTHVLMESEHGPSGNDGPGGGDEINFIQSGKNYGWPVVSHEKSKEGMESPLLVFTPAVAPASGLFYSGDKLPQLNNNFLVGLLKGEGILRVVVDESIPPKLLFYEKIPGISFGRIRDVIQGPDGYIYFSTSNKDGRGKPKSGDDKIMRIVPMRKTKG